jgi:uncharacterized RDD family membrane protein YckC
MSGVPEAPQAAGEQTPDASAGGEDLLGVRIAAALVDLALRSALFALLAATIGDSTVDEGRFSFTLDGTGLALYLVLVFVYYLAFELTIGQTIGKLLLSVRVVRTDPGRPSVAAIAIRTLLRGVDWLPVLYLVGFITMLATGARRQRLGDLAARTGMARAQPIKRRGVAAATVAVVFLVLTGVSFYRAGDDDTTDPTAQPTRNQDSNAVPQGGVLLQDDFSDRSSGWQGAALHEGETGYVDGAYRIFVRQAGRQLWANTGGDARVQALRVRFDAIQLTGTSGDLLGAGYYTDVASKGLRGGDRTRRPRPRDRRVRWRQLQAARVLRGAGHGHPSATSGEQAQRRLRRPARRLGRRDPHRQRREARSGRRRNRRARVRRCGPPRRHHKRRRRGTLRRPRRNRAPTQIGAARSPTNVGRRPGTTASTPRRACT